MQMLLGEVSQMRSGSEDLVQELARLAQDYRVFSNIHHKLPKEVHLAEER